MPALNSSREAIFQSIRRNLPATKVAHPGIPPSRVPHTNLKQEFEWWLKDAGGEAFDLGSPAEAEARLAALHPTATVICSAVPEIAGTRRVTSVRDPHELADVDVGVFRAQFGVAEAGAIWITQDDLIVDALALLSQHLVVLLDPRNIVANLHDAYRRLRLDRSNYGCFMMGPSATADVEATLVHGAQGARSLNLFFLLPGDRA